MSAPGGDEKVGGCSSRISGVNHGDAARRNGRVTASLPYGLRREATATPAKTRATVLSWASEGVPGGSTPRQRPIQRSSSPPPSTAAKGPALTTALGWTLTHNTWTAGRA